jgi:hypothetical protein
MRHIKTTISLFICLAAVGSSVLGQTVVIDHTCTDLDQVPDVWVNQARIDFKMMYGHTSHGSQISTGMQNLQSNYGDPYTYNATGSGGALYYDETSPDLGHPGDYPNPPWAATTRTYLNSHPDVNVVMWSWCGGASDDWGAGGMAPYFTEMESLEMDYGDVLFIYMTGHLDGTGESGNLHQNNEEIRAYCLANSKVLFDFADIESYDPDGNYFLDLMANDNCDYNGGNWAIEWCAAHPGSDLCWTCSCAHSQPLNCNLKGRAFWWMMAQLAGWDPAPVPPTGTPGIDVPSTSSCGFVMMILILSVCLIVSFKR